MTRTSDDIKPTRDVLLEAIGGHPGIKRAEMIAITGLTSGAIDPARIRLWQAGLIEPDSESGWKDALNNRVKDVGWRRVCDTEKQAEVKERATLRKERNAEPTAEEQAISIVAALKDPVVNKLVLEMTKDTEGSRRSQKRAAQALRAQQMARKREAAEAVREKAANAAFKRNLSRLWEARGAVGAIDQHLIEERARVAEGKARRVADIDWAMALNDVRTIITSFGAMWQNLRDLGGRKEPCPACGALPDDPQRTLGAFVIEGHAVEETDEVTVVDAEVVT
ncbi:MAG TPA: hypothetical protein VGF95_03020 [Solirubrobacteraceae bacterium]|jgi:hypothetical protein